MVFVTLAINRYWQANSVLPLLATHSHVLDLDEPKFPMTSSVRLVSQVLSQSPHGLGYVAQPGCYLASQTPDSLEEHTGSGRS